MTFHVPWQPEHFAMLMQLRADPSLSWQRIASELTREFGIPRTGQAARFEYSQLKLNGEFEVGPVSYYMPQVQPTPAPDKPQDAIDVPNVILISDTHCGCRQAIINPKVKITLDGGGSYEASPFQIDLWNKKWVILWNTIVPRWTKKEPFVIIHLGDIMDSVHHNSTTQISQNPVDQKRIAKTVLYPLTQMKGFSGLYIIRGTEAHSGASSHMEEELAQELGAIPDNCGNYARYELWKYVGTGSIAKRALIHCMHHIGTTGSQHYESTAIHKELIEALVEAGRWGSRAPDYVIRGHRHRYIATRIASDTGHSMGVVVPGWQGKTPFVFRMPGSRQSVPQFGAVLIRAGKEEHYLREQCWVGSRQIPE